MSDFNTELATIVRRQNHEMSVWHIVGVGNINTLFKMRPDISASNASPAERIWLGKLTLKTEHIRQSIEQYKTEIREFCDAYKKDPDNDPKTETSRANVFIRKLDDILNRLRLFNAMGNIVVGQETGRRAR